MKTRRNIQKGKSLTDVNPRLAQEWHPSLNVGLSPSDFTPGSEIKIWWKCNKGEDHVWLKAIFRRNQGVGCPICSGHVVVKSNCLATVNPSLANEWHKTKNGGLTPDQFTSKSEKKVWWKCSKGDDHVWLTSIGNRNRGSGCPVCSNKKVAISNCLATTNPKLANEWHPTKNGDLTPNDVVGNSGVKIWWKCKKGDDHEWIVSVDNRSNNKGNGCPICTGKKVVLSNSLFVLNSKLTIQWHPTKNGSLTPQDVTQYSHKKVWWKCDKGNDHEYEMSIAKKSNGRGCSVCSGDKVVKSNCLATLHPKLASEWHPTKNGVMTPFDVVQYSHKKIWWKCNKGKDHEWTSNISDRSFKLQNCPFCTLTPQSKQELIITFELIRIFNDINPKGFKTRINGKLWSIDIYIPQLNLGIEFDGSYWHKDKVDIDKLKTIQFVEEGFDIIRVREEPLEKIFENDIISTLPYNGKKVTDDILMKIMIMKNIDGRKIRKIKNYLSKEGIQNEKGLNKYIDLILTEKANKKK